MTRFVGEHFASVLVALILISGIIYFGLLRRLSPKGLLLTSARARRLRAASEVLSLGFCLVPYYSTALGVTVLIVSLLLTGSLLRRGWMILAMGETEYLALLDAAVRKTTRAEAFGFVLASAACFILIGLVMLALSPRETTWGFWPAIAVLYYGVGTALQQALWLGGAYRRIRSRDAGVVVGP